jgi:hypothetical protein
MLEAAVKRLITDRVDHPVDQGIDVAKILVSLGRKHYAVGLFRYISTFALVQPAKAYMADWRQGLAVNPHERRVDVLPVDPGGLMG